MNAAPSNWTQIEDEHVDLRRLIEEIDDQLNGPARDAARVRELMQHLSDEITEHFEHEEQGGYFAEAVRRAPRLQGTATLLLAQHPPLHEAIEALNSLASAGVESDAWWNQLSEDFSSFSHQLHEHEHGERALLQRAFAEDLGGGD